MTAPVTGWERLAQAVAVDVPPGEIDGVWTFPVLRHEQTEFGTAVLSRVDGDRRRIYTARYSLTVRGKERGKFSSAIEEVGSGPLEALAQLIADVPKRSDEEEPPAPVPVDTWFPPPPPTVEAVHAPE